MGKEHKPERKSIRRSGLSQRGVLHIPEGFLDRDKYTYRWIFVSDRTPYKLDERMQMGYERIPVSEFEALSEKLGESYYSNSSTTGGFIAKPGNGGMHYLMRIPNELKAEIDAEKREIVDETEQMLKTKAKQFRPDYGGADFNK